MSVPWRGERETSWTGTGGGETELSREWTGRAGRDVEVPSDSQPVLRGGADGRQRVVPHVSRREMGGVSEAKKALFHLPPVCGGPVKTARSSLSFLIYFYS